MLSSVQTERAGAANAGGLSALELSRLRWQCRRGLLELDLTLGRFLERHAQALSAEERDQFKVLLEMGDNELWDLICGRIECDDSFAGG